MTRKSIGKAIYLSSPYSDPDPLVQHQRFEEAWKATLWAWSLGYHVYSPVAYTHIIDILIPSIDYIEWLSFDIKLLYFCDELWVLMLPGWEESKGVQTEIRTAKTINIPIRYINPAAINFTEFGNLNWKTIEAAIWSQVPKAELEKMRIDTELLNKIGVIQKLAESKFKRYRLKFRKAINKRNKEKSDEK